MVSPTKEVLISIAIDLPRGANTLPDGQRYAWRANKPNRACVHANWHSEVHFNFVHCSRNAPLNVDYSGLPKIDVNLSRIQIFASEENITKINPSEGGKVERRTGHFMQFCC